MTLGESLTGAVPLGDARWVIPVPYGSNLDVRTNNNLETRLSVPSEVSIAAAALAMKYVSPDARLLICGEYYGAVPHTADLLSEAAQDYGVAPQRIHVLPGNFNNTYSQVHALAAFLASRQEIAAIIPLQYHLPRVQEAGTAYGLSSDKITYISAENILITADRSAPDYLEKLALPMRELERSERALRLLTKIDPKGWLLRLFSATWGPRIIDIAEDPDGTMRLEKTTARQKRAALRRSRCQNQGVLSMAQQ